MMLTAFSSCNLTAILRSYSVLFQPQPPSPAKLLASGNDLACVKETIIYHNDLRTFRDQIKQVPMNRVSQMRNRGHNIPSRKRISVGLFGLKNVKIQKSSGGEVFGLCGLRPCAFQIRWTEDTEMPVAQAIARALQCVSSKGGGLCVSSTTRRMIAADKGARPGGRLLSRKRPSTPSSK